MEFLLRNNNNIIYIYKNTYNFFVGKSLRLLWLFRAVLLLFFSGVILYISFKPSCLKKIMERKAHAIFKSNVIIVINTFISFVSPPVLNGFL